MDFLNALIQGLLIGGLYALFATGLSLMFGVMRIVNLAHGDLAVVASFLALALISGTGLPLWIVLLVTVPLFALLGYLTQRVLLQKSLRSGPPATLLVTFGLSIVLQNVLLETFSADTRTLDGGSFATGSFEITDSISIGYLSLTTFVLAALALTGIQLFLSRTGLGRMLRASSDDPETANLVGGDSRHIYGIATAIAFATVALAGLMFAMRSSFDPSIGPSRLIFAFEAVVIGGLGSLWGTLLGGMILGVTQSIGSEIDPALTLLAGHLIFLAVLAFRPQGLIAGRKA
ncbi:branched-chain amino acid ABC transporter permease [Actinoplanes italicus]|uniref:Amino acid/amide ABC transporter membrane protein 1 (HAAT family) n=1 Tax=Actinoplanes italicus TaxID=113567 RepID=A0A2T0K396_9ACTN|nr:branched-chain amino acid ABC transporter permease [Actinoplanes italicus]PRX17318.1 amino acid/amide ABC transporter membrane protein 1 (HAAT family) [Actinoplanes italicus]GIE35123.1 branched-chain amino acid ABC transporter permease [Actinoplanes italicus]